MVLALRTGAEEATTTKAAESTAKGSTEAAGSEVTTIETPDERNGTEGNSTVEQRGIFPVGGFGGGYGGGFGGGQFGQGFNEGGYNVSDRCTLIHAMPPLAYYTLIYIYIYTKFFG